MTTRLAHAQLILISVLVAPILAAPPRPDALSQVLAQGDSDEINVLPHIYNSDPKSTNKEVRALNAGADAAVYNAECGFGSAFQPGGGHANPCRVSPVEPIFKCSYDESGHLRTINGTVEACVETIYGRGEVTHYAKKIDTKEELRQSLEGMVEAEGSGFGAKMSGSLELMATTTTSNEFVMFTVGGFISDAKVERIKFPQKLKLTKIAKATLEKDPSGALFKKDYGSWFITAKSSGGYFTAYYNAMSKDSSSSGSVHATFDGSYQDYAKGKTDWEAKKESSGSSIDVHQDSAMRPLAPYDDAGGVEGMANSWTNFYNDMLSKCQNNDAAETVCNAVPNRLYWGSWRQLEEVQEIVGGGQSSEIFDSPTSHTMLRISTLDYIMTVKAKARAEPLISSFDWFSDTKKAEMQTLIESINQHILDLDNLTPEDLTGPNKKDAGWFVNMGATFNQMDDAVTTLITQDKDLRAAEVKRNCLARCQSAGNFLLPMRSKCKWPFKNLCQNKFDNEISDLRRGCVSKC